MSIKTYEDFVISKCHNVMEAGFNVEPEELNPSLYDFQRDITIWAIKRGRAAVFADCGLGKTLIQLDWANKICEKEGGSIIIFAPLAVSKQTRREGEKFGIKVNVCRTQKGVKKGINITNYEMLRHFDASTFMGIVLDESSILKSYDGVTRRLITDFAKSIKYRLACTATPAPNDITEILNH